MWENGYALSDTCGGNIQTVHILGNGNSNMKSWLSDSVPRVLKGALQALHSFVKSNSWIRGSAMQIQ